MSGITKLPNTEISLPVTGSASSTTIQSKSAHVKLSGPSKQPSASPSVPILSSGTCKEAAPSGLVSVAELAPPPTAGSSAPALPPLSDEPVRLWVGNIQPHVAEYQLLRLAQPAGTITKFDFMLHGAGPQAGRPRGYAFVSYSTHRQAEVGRRRLNGAPLAGARLVCRWAHEQVLPGDVAVKKEEPLAAPVAPAPTARPKLSAESQIRAIEAKLQHMTGGGGEERFSVKADSERPDLRRLPKVRGPLSWVNAPSKQAAQQPKPYARKRW